MCIRDRPEPVQVARAGEVPRAFDDGPVVKAGGRQLGEVGGERAEAAVGLARMHLDADLPEDDAGVLRALAHEVSARCTDSERLFRHVVALQEIDELVLADAASVHGLADDAFDVGVHRFVLLCSRALCLLHDMII